MTPAAAPEFDAHDRDDPVGLPVAEADDGADVSFGGRDVRFVINEEYTARVRELAAHAKRNSSATGEPAHRMLQVLGHLRGGNLTG